MICNSKFLNRGNMASDLAPKRKLKRLKMNNLFYGVLYISIFAGSTCAITNADNQKKSSDGDSIETHDAVLKDSRGLRMDYEKWKPLGRGDPLQNDPTYDYVPPVLERVHYWIDSPLRKQDTSTENKKSEILVLGVSSKKQSTQPSSLENRRDNYEPFLKFVDGPKFQQQNHNSFMRPNNMGQRPFHTQFYKNKFDDHHKLDEQRVPYTVLIPPPIPVTHPDSQIFKINPTPQPAITSPSPVYSPIATTTPSSTVTFQEANLVYQSSSTGKRPDDWSNNRNTYVTNAWSTTTEYPSNNIQLQEAETNINHVVFKDATQNKAIVQQSNKIHHNSPIVFPTEPGKIVFEQHSTIPNTVNEYTKTQGSVFLTKGPIIQPIKTSTKSPKLQLYHVTNPLSNAATQVSVGSNMHKGQVSDDSIGNAYVNIGKPNAHIQQDFTANTPLPGPVRISDTTESTYITHNSIASTVKKPYISTDYPHHSIFLNRPMESIPISAINNIIVMNNAQPFHKRPYTIRDYTMKTMQKMHPPPFPTTEAYRVITRKPSGFLHSLLQDEHSTTKHEMNISQTYETTTYTPTTTVMTSLTTDPLFKHYKQPVEPLKGPMYLIIQGHSKVKTYGPTNKEKLNDLSMAEDNEISKTDEYPAKHMHSLKDMLETNDEIEQASKTRAKNARTLKELISDGVGKYDIKETELMAGFEVSDDQSIASSEKYHKGIVETDENKMAELRKLKKFAKIREKRQIEEFLPVVEDTVESVVYDYLKRQSEGSGVDAFIASAITYDSSEEDNRIGNTKDDYEDDDDDIL